MRKKRGSIRRDSAIAILYILCILIVFTIFVPHSAMAQGDELIIDVIDNIYEYEEFIVSVYTLDEEGIPYYQIDVYIGFDGKIYNITDESAEITLQAPEVSEDKPHTINATKTGFVSNTTTILVKNKQQLKVIPDEFTVEANTQFSVMITDETETPISGATVGIQGYTGEGSVATTNNNGRAWLKAPEEHSEIIVRAEKEGYYAGTETIGVRIAPGLLELLLQSEYTPIGIAVILLIVAIMFVRMRQKKALIREARETEKQQPVKQHTVHGAIVSPPPNKETVQIEPRRGPKVEEIRISRPRKDKEVVPVNTEENGPAKQTKKQDYNDWFEGTDDIRYEIDKLTGEIDEEGKDKWFEGIDDIRAKIDEKVKKKDKKKEK
jgi:hypothetical protein